MRAEAIFPAEILSRRAETDAPAQLFKLPEI
jgi:hypothetical protein